MLIRKVKFYGSVGALYALTLLFALQAFNIQIFKPAPVNSAMVFAETPPPPPPERVVIAAKPVRIVSERIGLDLPVSDGVYDPVKQTWTLSDNHAHFATLSAVPNDFQGNTLIYGHNYDWVFGILEYLRPGDTLQLYGEDGRVFQYVYQDTQKLTPEDNSVFRYDGVPSVTVQTCSGRFNESRQMYNFILEKVT